jgi:hypothetical protein
MQTSNYFLPVHVSGLDADNYNPTSGELRIFWEDHGEWLAFETDDWYMEGTDIISWAVVWYARYLNYPKMQITTNDPRSVFTLKNI